MYRLINYETRRWTSVGDLVLNDRRKSSLSSLARVCASSSRSLMETKDRARHETDFQDFNGIWK